MNLTRTPKIRIRINLISGFVWLPKWGWFPSLGRRHLRLSLFASIGGGLLSGGSRLLATSVFDSPTSSRHGPPLHGVVVFLFAATKFESGWDLLV
ncbi:hypothetical protein Q3G72_022058 [Acer saccharum]|nr:hypothetical protein Q3G72_022058 [Acer saccharum]